LDHRIIDFAASLPQSFKIRGLTQKYLLKQVMKDKLPDAVLRRGKAGFDVPLHDWFRSVLRPMLLDTLNPRALQRVAVFEPNAIQDLIRAHLEKRANFGYHLWGLLILFRWIERWGVEVPLLDARRRHPVPSMLAAR
jgi:asparagine synthase (glutamine-hydrolysing)